MKYQVNGLFGEAFELSSGAGAADAAPLVMDEELLRLVVEELLASPINRELLREHALEDPLLGGGELANDQALAELAVRALSSGTLRLVPQADGGGSSGWRALTQAADLVPQAQAQAQAQPAPRPPPVQEEPKLRDHKIECKHHTSKGRAF